jgi:hypothetical protein
MRIKITQKNYFPTFLFSALQHTLVAEMKIKKLLAWADIYTFTPYEIQMFVCYNVV